MARGERYDGILLDDDLNLWIRPEDWPGIHGNHSCDPNVWLEGSVEMSARHDIHAGEDATTDYATYTMTPDWSMACSCSSSVCRKVVTGEDWRLGELQRSYAGHFALPIERRMRVDEG